MGVYELKKDFRLTEEQWNYIEKKSEECGISVSAYLRILIEADRKNESVALNKKEDFLLLRSYRTELGHIGNNINQIAHNVNSHIYNRNDKARLYDMLQNINKTFLEICERLG